MIDCFGGGTNKRREKYSETNTINYFWRGTAYYLTFVPGSSHLALQPPWLFREGPMASSVSGRRVQAGLDGLCCPGHLGGMLWGLSHHQETRLPLNQRIFWEWKHPKDTANVFNIDLKPWNLLCIHKCNKLEKYYPDTWHLNPSQGGSLHCLENTLVNMLGIWRQWEPRPQSRKNGGRGGPRGEENEEKGAAQREAGIKEMMMVPTYVYA